jgi:predicted metal-dependent peptidase
MPTNAAATGSVPEPPRRAAGDDAPALHTHRGTRAVQRMVEYAPASGGLALWVQHRDLSPADEGQVDAEAPLVSTDGHTLRYRAGFAQLPMAQQTGWVAHGVLHIGLRHVQRYHALQQQLGDVDLKLYNTCADAIVNSTLGHLGWLQLPAGGLQLPTLLAQALGREQGVEAALLEWDVERLYRAVDDRRQPERGGRDEAEPRRDGPRAAVVRALGSGNPADLAPAPGQKGPPEAEAEQAREWRERLMRAHTGDGEHSMLRCLIADLPRSRTPWQQLLRTQLARGLSRRRTLSWSRPARSYIANQGRAGPQRRMPWEPGFSTSSPVPRLVVVVDVSGSIEPGLLERFAREVDAITRRQEAGLTLVIGDDRVRSVEQAEPGRSGLSELRFTGGGGTDFTPLLEEAERHRPDLIVVLTDLDGPAGHRPRCPVIWAVPEDQAGQEAPFGRRILIG